MDRRLLPFVVASCLILAAAGARADGYKPADKAATVAQPVSIWTGFYANAGVGYGLWDAQQTTDSTFSGTCASCAATDHAGKGWLGEVGFGYDRRLSDRIVAGLLFNYDVSDLRGRSSDAVFTTGNTRNDRTWFVGARVGWLMTPDILNYWSVGYTRTHFSGASLRNSYSGAELPNGAIWRATRPAAGSLAAAWRWPCAADGSGAARPALRTTGRRRAQRRASRLSCC
jgi:outer membrane immunogenic protein